MKVERNVHGWTLQPGTDTEEKVLAFLIEALEAIYTTNHFAVIHHIPAEGQKLQQKTDEQTEVPFAGFRPRSPAEAEKTFPEWFARLGIEDRLAWIFELDDKRHPNRKKPRNQGYGSVSPESETL